MEVNELFLQDRTVSHGLRKESEVPPEDIDKAITRKKDYERDSKSHS
jgi:hypothetical protein